MSPGPQGDGVGDGATLSPSRPRDGDTHPCRVSSVLNRDVKQFGKKHMFDANEETCWNSDQVLG